MLENAQKAASFLKAMANENRLLILLGIRQPTLSQQLARLRADSLVATRRAAKLIYYSLASDDAHRVIQLLEGRLETVSSDKSRDPQRLELAIAE